MGRGVAAAHGHFLVTCRIPLFKEPRSAWPLVHADSNLLTRCRWPALCMYTHTCPYVHSYVHSYPHTYIYTAIHRYMEAHVWTPTDRGTWTQRTLLCMLAHTHTLVPQYAKKASLNKQSAFWSKVCLDCIIPCRNTTSTTHILFSSHWRVQWAALGSAGPARL